MKIFIILSLSAVSIYFGISGYIYNNKPKTEVSKTRFDPKLRADKLSFSSSKSVKSARIASIKRMGVKKDRKFRSWTLDEFDKIDPLIRISSLEELGYFSDEEVNTFIFSKLDSDYRTSALKALGKIENEKRAELLENIDISKFSKIEQIYFHLASFKSNIYFSKKKKSLNSLIDMANNLEDSKELELIVNSLAVHVPNFKKYHELLKDLLFKSNNNIVLERSVKHLAVYETGWLKIQMTKIIKSKDLQLIKVYLDRAGAVCPIKLWENISELYQQDSKLALESAFLINTKKAIKLLNSKEKKGSKIYKDYENKFKEKVELCY